MMYGQVYMCSRYIDQLHCLARATLSNRLLAHFRTTASTYISKVSIYINIYQDTAGALWYNSFNIKGSSRPSAPGPLCTSGDGLWPNKMRRKMDKKKLRRKIGTKSLHPPCARVRWYMMEVRRTGRDVVNQFHQHQRPREAISLSQDLCNSH